MHSRPSSPNRAPAVVSVVSQPVDADADRRTAVHVGSQGGLMSARRAAVDPPCSPTLPVGADVLQIVAAQHQALDHLLLVLLARHAAEVVAEPANLAAARAQTRDALEHAADDVALLCGAKEAVLYPAARAARTDDILLQSLQDHLVLQRMLAGLLHLPAGADAFQPCCTQLLQQVRSHHRAEEDALFLAMRQVARPERLAELGRQLLGYQAGLRLRGQPHLRMLGQADHVGH